MAHKKSRQGKLPTGIRRKGSGYGYRYRDENDIEREPIARTVKAAVELRNAALVEVARRKRGIVDPFAAHRARPLAEHVEEHVNFIRSKGVKARHVAQVRTRLKNLLAGIGAELLTDLDAVKVSAWLEAQRAPKVDPKTGDEVPGLAPETSNHYTKRAKAFTAWLVKHGRIPFDPFATLTTLNAKADLRHDRGALSSDEFSKLIVATAAAGPVRNLTGEQRAMLYLVAADTGLRAQELASLTPASFQLEGDPPLVNVRASHTKNGDEVAQPLRGELRDLLRPFLEGLDPRSPVWPGPWWKRAALILQVDLARVDIPYVDADNRFRDFHALRHRFGTELARGNVGLKVAQTLMRHSDPRLTANRYTHLAVHDVVGALDRLPPLPSMDGRPEAVPMAATGTDGQHIGTRVSHALPTPETGAGGSEVAGSDSPPPVMLTGGGIAASEITVFDGVGGTTTGGDCERRRADSNRRWRFCRPTPDAPNDPGPNELRADSDVASRTIPADNCHFVPDLTRVIEAWPSLSDAARARVLELIASEEGGRA